MNNYNETNKYDWKSVQGFSPRKILDLFGITKPPVDPFWIANQLGIKTYELSKSHDKKWIIDYYGSPAIFINQESSYNNQRFSCACRLGHIVLGHTYSKDLVCGVDWKGLRAVMFASNLLAPKSWLGAYSWVTGADIARLALIFGVSEDVIKAQK